MGDDKTAKAAMDRCVATILANPSSQQAERLRQSKATRRVAAEIERDERYEAAGRALAAGSADGGEHG